MVKVVIFSRGAGNQQYGLGQDARLLELTFKEMNKMGKTQTTIIHKDPYLYIGKGEPEHADVHIYIEVPCRVAFYYAKVNVVIPNAEWWHTPQWNWVFTEPSVYFMFRSRHAERVFHGVRGSYIGWRSPPVELTDCKKKEQVLYIIGGSENKQKAASVIVDAWKPEYPPLLVFSASAAPSSKENVRWTTEYISVTDKIRYQNESKYHCVASTAEGFGYTFAEAMALGAQPLWTDLPVYSENWESALAHVGRIETNAVETIGRMDGQRTFTKEAVWSAMESLLAAESNGTRLRSAAITLTRNFRTDFQTAWKRIEGLVTKEPTMPTLVNTDLPVVGVITLMYNRPEWFSHAVRNIELCSYPREKLVWILVDDSDNLKRIDSAFERVRSAFTDIKCHYVSLPMKTNIGEKRNKGCAAALAFHNEISVFAFMDDDDHYPPDSLTRRVSWLMSSGNGAVACSVLPMYDLRHYISAMNVPPLDLAPNQRVSEATLCFTRKFWEEGRFPATSVAEGEEFLKDRHWKEIPPDGIIVSFLHGKNSTSRRIPDTKEPNGCHYGFTDEYFTMIHQIASLS
jgi:hypothetical protein